MYKLIFIFLSCSRLLYLLQVSLSELRIVDFLLCLYLFCFFQSVFCRFCYLLLSNISHFINISSDINECEDNPCGENAICKDTIGSFVCSCKEDYTGDPFKGCVDINECVSLEKPCGTHAICENAAPGYNCICPQGYQASPSPQVACEQVSNIQKSTKHF